MVQTFHLSVCHEIKPIETFFKKSSNKNLPAKLLTQALAEKHLCPCLHTSEVMINTSVLK